MSRRAEHRRNDREAARRCLTVSDVFLINWMRRLPTDHPSRGMRKHKNKPQRPRMAFPIHSEAAQAWRYLRVIRASAAARKVSKWLKTSIRVPRRAAPPRVILLAMFLAAEVSGTGTCEATCARLINGLDATILHHLGPLRQQDPRSRSPTAKSKSRSCVSRTPRSASCSLDLSRTPTKTTQTTTRSERKPRWGSSASTWECC